LRRRAGRPGAGDLLLSPGGADRARHRLGYPLSACTGMGLLPRSGARGAGAQSRAGGLRMGIRAIKLPDVGEGVAEAEVVEWHVKVGDVVKEDQTLAAVMTDKATVEIPAPFAGTVVSLAAEIGGIVP